MKKRSVALVLSLLMTAGMLTACGSEKPEETGGSGTSGGGSAVSGTESAAGTGEGAPAGVNFDEEPYEATFMYYAANDARDVEAVEAAFNELTMAELNMKVHLMPVTFGTYNQQIQMILSSDDSLDIFPYYSGLLGTYKDAGFVIDMGEYIDEYGQDMVEIIGEEDVNCGYLSGFLGGVPTMHERTNPVMFVMRTDILEETGFTAEDIKTLDDMTQVLAKVKELHPEMNGYGGTPGMSYPLICSNSRVDNLGADNYGVLLNQGQDTEVVNWYESEEFIHACEVMREWNQAGYTSADFATCTDGGETLMKAGNLFCFSTFGKPNTKVEKDAQTGYDTTCVQVTADACYTSTTNATLYGIAGNSEDPGKAVILLNWIYKTKAANDLINWGIEGKDYVVLEDGTIDFPEGVSSENVGYHQDYGWAHPNQYNSYIWTGNDPALWDKYQEVRDNAVMSKAYGFMFDNNELLNEYSAMGAIRDEYLNSIATGSVDTKPALEEFNAKLYDAGLQDVIDAKQEQLDAWLAEQ